MSDGHTGIENKFFDDKNLASNGFNLAFSFLIESNHRGGYFVIHVSPRTNYFSGLKQEEFLEMLGFRRGAVCQKFHDQCLFKYVFEHPIEGRINEQAVDHAHTTFNKFAADIDKLYEHARELTQGVGRNSNIFPWAEQFNDVPKKIEIPDPKPAWLSDFKTPEHSELEKELQSLEDRRKHFETIQFVLWGKGNPLVDAVQYLLEDMLLLTTITPEGSTIDLRGNVKGRSDLKFGIEVTGINEAVKKGSRKIGQLLTFQQEREEDEKALLIVNTFYDINPNDRKEDSFTPEAKLLLKPLGAVGLNTITLYKLWQDIKIKGKDAIKAWESIYKHKGGVYGE